MEPCDCFIFQNLELPRKKERGSLLSFPHFLHVSFKLDSSCLVGLAMSTMYRHTPICSEDFGILMYSNFEPNAYLAGIGPHCGLLSVSALISGLINAVAAAARACILNNSSLVTDVIMLLRRKLDTEQL